MHLNVREVSKLMRVSEKRVNEWIRSGILHADRVNQQYQFHRCDLLERTVSREIDVRTEIFSASKRSGNHTPSLVESLRAGGTFQRVHGTDKQAVLQRIVETLSLPPSVSREAISQLLFAREAMGSTAIGEGIAIPHVRRPILLNAPRASISLHFLEHPVDIGGFDGEPVFAIFLLISPTARTHLYLLSRLSFALHDSNLKAALARRAPAEEILTEFQRVEDAMLPQKHHDHIDAPE
ncbi:MAG TPA: PTS sugar transporter subunit IIA [Candidatus Binataceae bacterium]|nr:PTS sugar transporter subunit IIA [Candidatus Binataceae bacterium]